jgi:hypothetical protein
MTAMNTSYSKAATAEKARERIRLVGNGFQYDYGRAQFGVRDYHIEGAATVQSGPGVIDIPIEHVRAIGEAMVRFADNYEREHAKPSR